MKIQLHGPSGSSPSGTAGRTSTTWLGIRAEIMARISARVYPPGALIPTEQALAKEFGCARATVNRALTSLARRGVLERRRRIGTRVAQGMNPGASEIAVPIMRHFAEERGHKFRFELLPGEDRVPPPDVTEHLFRSDPTQLHQLRTLFYGDDLLFCFERRWVDLAALPGLTDDILRGTTANEWIAGHAALTLVEHTIQACSARDADAAQQLNCQPDAPVLVLDTCLWSGTNPVSWARHSFVPGFVMSQMSDPAAPGAALPVGAS